MKKRFFEATMNVRGSIQANADVGETLVVSRYVDRVRYSGGDEPLPYRKDMRGILLTNAVVGATLVVSRDGGSGENRPPGYTCRGE